MESYGISKATSEVRGAEMHIKRLRESITERGKEPCKFQFTFKKVPREVEIQAEKMREVEREKKAERVKEYKK